MKKARRNFVKKSVLGAAGFSMGAHTLKALNIGNIFGRNQKYDPENLEINLLKDESAWTTFAPREEITPLFSKKASNTVEGHQIYYINGNNYPVSFHTFLPYISKKGNLLNEHL